MQSNHTKNDSSIGITLISASIVLSLIVILICSMRSQLSPMSCSSLPDPKITVNEYFGALKQSDYAKCDKYISNYSSIGMNGTPQTEVGTTLRKLLIESYDYRMVGECRISGKTAVQTVSIRYLDLSLFSQALNTTANEIANEMNFNGIDIFDEETAFGIMLTAIESYHDRIGEFYITEELDINMEYSDSQWKIIYDDNLDRIMTGNAANA